MYEPLILCPLEHEARALRARLKPLRVEVCGPGRAVGPRVRALCEPRPRLVVLAGLCGGLVECEIVPRITRVTSTRGQVWRVPVTLRESGQGVAPGGSGRTRRLHESREERDGATLIGVDEVVRSARAKRALGERFGGELCDMESHHFAFACVDIGVRWGVVRGVSDGPADELPRGVERLVDAQGDAKLGAALRHCATRPWEIGSLLRLKKRSEEALKHVASAVEELIRTEERDGVRSA